MPGEARSSMWPALDVIKCVRNGTKWWKRLGGWWELVSNTERASSEYGRVENSPSFKQNNDKVGLVYGLPCQPRLKHTVRFVLHHCSFGVWKETPTSCGFPSPESTCFFIRSNYALRTWLQIYLPTTYLINNIDAKPW